MIFYLRKGETDVEALQAVWAQFSAAVGQWLAPALEWLGNGFTLSMRILLAALAVWIVERCGRSLLRGKLEREVWARLVDPAGKAIHVYHWENTLGRSRRCDIVLPLRTVSRNHAVLLRDGGGAWAVAPLQAKNGLTVNGKQLENGQRQALTAGDVVNLGGLELTFQPITREEERLQAQNRTKPGRAISPVLTLLLLTLFQVSLFSQLVMNLLDGEDFALLPLAAAFGGVCALMWLSYLIYRIFRRRGFELETLAFFLATLSMAVTASASPSDLYTQLAALILGVALFFLLSLVLRSLKLALKLRWAAAGLACALLAFNLLFGQTLFGAKNWVSIGPVSFQPSELVKLAFILAGATTLERMFARQNLIFTLLFSGFCVGCLALMSDFGTAVIFFMAFLAIAFLRSGDLPSVAFLSCTAVFAGFLVLKFKSYIASRFTVYRHVWEDPSGYGYQQTRTMSAIASGGLFGNGAGNGWLKNLGASETDLVFGVLSEELGLIVAVAAVAVIVLFAVAAVKYSAAARSSFYAIAACSTAMLLVVQTMLNVFGSTDLLPLTGVTFPFVSCGGSSMLACWGLLAFIKAADTRQNASLAVPLPRRRSKTERRDGNEDDQAWEDLSETRLWRGGRAG
ncbi:MAG: FtsW/RodA/SpoVE family cell cycle protein [Oscillospiraceae bacterium]|nr:FtsW/RodA/SpoVE family cell cycle protein [Oscillospiraceae bacterium]